MTGQRETVVVLTDGEQTLAHALDQIRDTGIRVLATSRPYEAAVFASREPVLCFVARAPLLPDDSGDFIRRIRDGETPPFVVITGPEDRLSTVEGPLVDLAICEPLKVQTLADAIAFARARRAGAPEPLRDPIADNASEQPIRPERMVGQRGPRLLACIRRLTELERDPDTLLGTALEMFLEAAEAERGSLLIATPDRTLEVARRSGFPSGHEPTLAVAEQFAPEAARDKCPRIILSVPRDEAQRPEATTSCLVIPLLDQRALVGVVALSDRRGGESFSEADLESVSHLARQFVINQTNAVQFAELQRMAVVDPLTGLFNRRFFERQFAVELERARRYGRQVTLALIDIDRFKLFNDLNGYGTGDHVIRDVAEVLRQNFREVDVVTRWGGDEFAIILPETGKPRVAEPGLPATRNYVERVRASVEAFDFSKRIASIGAARITISAGVATYPVDATDPGVLFDLANKALFRAKKSGQNRVCIAEIPPPTESHMAQPGIA